MNNSNDNASLWKSVSLDVNCSIREAIEAINKGAIQIGLIVDKSSRRLEGLITDSDIRKGLLKGFDLDESVRRIMNPNPLVVSESLSPKAAKDLMRLNHCFHLPIVDTDGLLVGLHIAEQLDTSKDRSETLVIMAGGRGKRLMPLTNTVPKPMLEVRGKPMLENVIDRARGDGFKKIVISVNYKAEVIKEYFKDGEQFGVDIEYIQEHVPLGTAGALSLLSKRHSKQLIVVTNSDLVTDVSMGEILDQAHRSCVDGLMAVRIQEWQSPFGVVTSSNRRIIEIREKPVYSCQVNAGIYVLGPELHRLLEVNSYCDMPDLFTRGVQRGLRLEVYPILECWTDVGIPEEYEAIR